MCLGAENGGRVVKYSRVIKSFYIIVFCCIVAIPFIFANREPDKISESENRYLKNLPTAQFGTEDYKQCNRKIASTFKK